MYAQVDSRCCYNIEDVVVYMVVDDGVFSADLLNFSQDIYESFLSSFESGLHVDFSRVHEPVDFEIVRYEGSEGCVLDWDEVLPRSVMPFPNLHHSTLQNSSCHFLSVSAVKDGSDLKFSFAMFLAILLSLIGTVVRCVLLVYDYVSNEVVVCLHYALVTSFLHV
jgi:hypothetical protein